MNVIVQEPITSLVISCNSCNSDPLTGAIVGRVGRMLSPEITWNYKACNSSTNERARRCAHAPPKGGERKFVICFLIHQEEALTQSDEKGLRPISFRRPDGLDRQQPRPLSGVPVWPGAERGRTR